MKKRTTVNIFIVIILFFFYLNTQLKADDNWPKSFKKFSYNSTRNDIKNILEDDPTRYFFNKGYNPNGDKYEPIPSKYHNKILEKLINNLNKSLSDSTELIKNCSFFNNLFGKMIKKNLPNVPKTLCISHQIGGDGTITNMGFFIHSKYFNNFIYHIGKQLRDINNGQMDDINISPDHFDLDRNGNIEGNPIKTNMGHELMHFLSGFNGGGLEAECVVHCLTKKCIDPNWKLKENQYTVIGEPEGRNLECHKISDKYWTRVESAIDIDVGKNMKKGKCFCDEEWTKDAKCDENNPTPTIPGSGSVGSSVTDRKAIAYIPDLPDDHYSFADFIGFSDIEIDSNSVGNYLGDMGNDYVNFSFYPDILIYNKYGTSLMGNLLDRMMQGNYMDDYTHDYFSSNHKILVIPSSALIGDSRSEIVKQAIMNFLESGKSVVLFSQQFGKDIKNLIPMAEGEIGPVVGFREDSSCLKNSAYFTEMHPILSSTTSGILDVGIDGYATIGSNSNATVLLRRKVNGEPALLYYKYGAGTIYLFFGFTDFANSRSMASVQELKLVKNMLRHAMAPDVYIPIFDLEENPNPTIGLNIQVFNHTETQAAKAKISVFTIDNTPVYETEASVSLSQGESAEIPITFTLPDLESKDYGIGFTVYELKDAEGNLIQLKTETPTGRFSIYKLITPANIDGGLYRWITVNDEVAFWGQDIECTMHFKNTTHQVKQVEINDPYFAVAHSSTSVSFGSFSASINPGETYEHTAYLPTTEFSQWDNHKISFRIKYYDSEGNYKQFGAGKVVYVKKALTQSIVELNHSIGIDPGSSINYSIHSFSDSSIAGETTVKLALEKYTGENSSI